MEEVTVKCGCGRTMALDARRGRGAFRCGCRATIQITEAPRSTTRCVGTASDGTPCRHAAVRTEPLPLCEHHYASTGLKQYHKWRVSGPEVMATDMGSFFDAVAFGRSNGTVPKELLEYRAQIYAGIAEEREREARGQGRVQNDDYDVAHGAVVYFVRLDERVKIGKTYNLSQRLQTFANPLIQAVATEPGYTVREKQLHKRFEALHVAGEWFRLEAPLTDYIRALPGYRKNLGRSR